jgi:WD40 repeat protein
MDMVRRNPRGLPHRFETWAGPTAALLMAAGCLVVAAVGPLRSAPENQARATTDSHGDPLPAGALARLGTTRLRHGGDVNFVAFGPGDKTLLTAGQDNTIRLWDLADGKELRRFARPKQPAPKAPPKGGKPGAKEQVEVETVIQLMAGGGNNQSSFRVAVTADGKTLAVAEGTVIELWEVETGKQIRRIEDAPGGFAGLIFSPDGKTLAARTGNGTLVLWAVETGKEISQIKPAPRPKQDGIVLILGGNDTPPPGMAFTPDGKALAAAATDYKKQEAIHSVKFWDVASREEGKETRRIQAPASVNVSAVAISPDGKLLAYGGGGVVHLCMVDTGKEVRQLKAPGGVFALLFAPDGKTLAVRGRNRVVRLWETETGNEIRQLGEAMTAQRGGGFVFLGAISRPETRALAISRDGKQIAAGSGSTVRLWETATGKELPLLDGHRGSPAAVRLSADGKSVVSWGADQVVRRWDAATGKLLGGFPAPQGTQLAAFAPDGQTIALANADNTIRLHESATGKDLRRLQGPKGGAAALAFAPDGKVLALRGSDNVIRLYDVASGAEQRQIVLRSGTNPNNGRVLVIGGPRRTARGTAPGLAFSPDGKQLVVPGPGTPGNTLVFLDLATGKELRKIESPRPISSFAFSPDGRTLAAESNDRTITLWEVASGKERNRLGTPVAERQGGNGQMGGVLVIEGLGGGDPIEPAGAVGVTYAPDGRSLAVRGADRQVHFWDVAAGKDLGGLPGHSGRIETVAFSPDGKTLASGSADTTILVWDAAGRFQSLSKPQTAELPAAEVETLWGDLGGQDAGKALRGILKLAGAPQQAVPFLGARLKPAERVDPQKINGWIGELDSEKFAVRQQAVANLLKVGEQAVPALQKVLASSPALETRKRIEELVDRLTGGTLTAEQLRLVRAVEALERMGSPESRRLLETLAAGAPGTLPTREAQAALARGQKSEVRGR